MRALSTDRGEAARQRPGSLGVVLLWGYLGLIGAAELITSLASLQIGLILHIGLQIGLLVHGSLAAEARQRAMLLSLSLAPLIRILSLTLPLNHFPRLAWYPLVGAPLIGAAWVLMHQLRLGGGDVGLRARGWGLQLLIGLGGWCLGAIEYQILRPEPIVGASGWQQLLLAALILFVGTGFMEELVFRGLLQTVAVRALGGAGVLYIAGLFAVLHIGYLSLADVLFVGLVGCAFGYVVLRSGSLLGVTVAHGITNIVLFIVLPNDIMNPSLGMGTLISSLTWASAGLSLLGLVWLAWPDLRRVSGRIRTARSSRPGS